MIRLTLCIRINRSRPATSTPRLNAVRIVTAARTAGTPRTHESSVNVRAELRRHMFFQISGKTSWLSVPRQVPSRGAAYAVPARQHGDRA